MDLKFPSSVQDIIAQAVLCPEIKQVAASTDVSSEAVTLEEVAKEYLNICDNDCCGDNSLGIPCCPFYFFPDVMDDRPILGKCKLKFCIEEEG